jgi:hypothetical protein
MRAHPWGGAALFVLLLSAVSLALSQEPVRPAPQDAVAPDEEIAYVCPMHPDQTSQVPGTCPKCGMTLIRATPFDVRDYGLEFRTVPSVIKPGQKATLKLTVLRPGTGEPVKSFEPVHEKQYHLFVISQDMEYFQHIHPVLQSDGAWSIDVALPKPGYYKVLSDFLPSGGAAQFLARGLVTERYSGDLTADSAHLVADAPGPKVDGDLTATVSLDPATFLAGQWGHINFHLTDTSTHQPIADLQTYLGAFGHTLIMSEDMVDYVHSHPLNIVPGSDEDGAPPIFIIPPDADLEQLRGGPDVTFEGLMPKPGMYRAWTQFRRGDKIHTFAVTFKVDPRE